MGHAFFSNCLVILCTKLNKINAISGYYVINKTSSEFNIQNYITMSEFLIAQS